MFNYHVVFKIVYNYGENNAESDGVFTVDEEISDVYSYIELKQKIKDICYPDFQKKVPGYRAEGVTIIRITRLPI